MTTQTIEVSIPDIHRRVCDLELQGWHLAKITTYRSEGVRKACVTTVKETE